MSTQVAAAKEDWTGLTFGNNWEILQKFNCAEYRNIYQQATGDFSKQIKNVHYLVTNHNCGINTYMERTVIQRALRNKTPIMSKCKGCISGSRKNNNTCHYAEACRNKPLTKIPDRSQKIEVGKTYGNFLVNSVISSLDSADHACRANVTCIHCGKQQTVRFASLLECACTCDCFRPYSSGAALVKFYLEDHHITYKAEQSFDDLVSPEGGYMRYDFAIYKNNKIIALIEFDGQQHFEEAGSFYNPTGAVQIHDELKNQYAKDHNIPLKRIRFDETLFIYKILDDFFASI